MQASTQAGFDKIAPQYDAVWSDTLVGKAQRSAVWKLVDPLFREGELVLDLGCGTGVDAVHLQSRGVSVYAIDGSPQMIRIARSRNIDAHCLAIEDLEQLDLHLDGALSNFGALNCISSLSSVAGSLARMIRSGGRLALCFMSRFCLSEVAVYLAHARPGKAFRRLRGRSESSLSATVFYPSAAVITHAFSPAFRLLTFYGIGLAVPPSYVTSLTEPQIQRLSALDQRLFNTPVFRSLADHRLYLFERI